MNHPHLILLDIPIAPTDPLLWLAQQEHAQKVFWSDREGQLAVAGVGVAKLFQGSDLRAMKRDWQQMQRLMHLSSPNVRFFGGMRFCHLRPCSLAWQSWDSYAWILPRFVLEQANGAVTLRCHVVMEPGDDPAEVWEQVFQEVHRLTWQGEPGMPRSQIDRGERLARSRVERRIDRPEKTDWCSLLEQTSSLFTEGHMDKIVWARETELQLAERPDPLAWMLDLRERSNHSFLFLLQLDHENTFLGASPERLFSRNDRQIVCDALAGTAPRSADPAVDHELGQALLQSAKDRYEQALVFDALASSLREVCQTVDTQREPVLRKLQHVQHLWSGLCGTLKPDVTDWELLRRLHPTPAVGGWPRHRALEMLAAREPFDRGWYAAPVGWVGSNGADFAVAIRSALVQQQRVYLYTGAGIVPDSQAVGEWQELEDKLQTFLELFQMP